MIIDLLAILGPLLFVFGVLSAFVGEWRWFAHLMLLSVACGVEVEFRNAP